MSRNDPEYTEMFNKSGYFEREIAMLHWFINNAEELYNAYNEELDDTEKLTYEVWLKKAYGINVVVINNSYKVMMADETKAKIITETEEKIKSGEIDVIKESVRWAKGVISRRKSVESGKLGQAAWQANGKKHGKSKEMTDGGETR